MKIDLTKIYKGLKTWRHERGITAKGQKEEYIINVMEKFGELASPLRDYEKSSKAGLAYNLSDDLAYYDTIKKVAEHEIINIICEIAVFTINAGADINCNEKTKIIDTIKTLQCNSNLSKLMVYCGEFNYYGSYVYFNNILVDCAEICESYGYNFEIAMLETIKKISSLTGIYDEKAKKWVKNLNNQTKSEWYQANYELARR